MYCVSCGDYVPEGRQICIRCEAQCDHYYPIYAVQRLEQVCAFCGKKTDLFHDGICPECYGFD